MQKPECGCDCDVTTQPARSIGSFLTEQELRDLLEQKIARVRRQREMMDRIQGQLETD